MQYQCFVAGCDKQYLYMSSLKKHLVISHPKEYAAKVKTRQSKCWEGLILSSSSKRLQGMGHYNLGATTADEGGQTRRGAWNWLPQKLSRAILRDISFHWWRVRRPWWWRAPSVKRRGYHQETWILTLPATNIAQRCTTPQLFSMIGIIWPLRFLKGHLLSKFNH